MKLSYFMSSCNKFKKENTAKSCINIITLDISSNKNNKHNLLEADFEALNKRNTSVRYIFRLSRTRVNLNFYSFYQTIN